MIQLLNTIIYKAINLLKWNEALPPGVDNITSKILKDGGKAVREWLLRI